MEKKLKSGVDALQGLDNNPSLLQAVKAVGEFYSDNTLENRRNLRSEIESRTLQNIRDVLRGLEEVETRLAKLRGEVGQLRKCCNDMETQLTDTKAAAGRLAARAAELKGQREEAALKLRLAEKFVALFTLTAAETAALSANDVSEAFFAALTRVHGITNNAKLLMRAPATQQCGLDILDRMTDLMDKAYDKITAFAQQQFGSYSKDSLEPSKLLCMALRMLSRERPSLLKFCVEEIEQARKQAVVAMAVKALTTGGPNGVPGPIDASANDYVRYFADMLGWCHQTLASESELLESLFGFAEAAKKSAATSSTSASSSSSSSSSGFGVGSGVVSISWKSVVGNTMDLACRPLRARMENVIKATHDLVLAHELRSVVQHYRVSLSSLIEDEQLPPCALLVLLSEVQAQLKLLYDTLVQNTAQEARAFSSVHPDLGAPSILHRVINQAGRIAGSADTSLLPIEERTSDALLKPLVSPLLEMCQRVASSLSAELGYVFLINCLVLLRDVLGPHRVAHEMVSEAVARIAEAEKRVGEAEASVILLRAGLATVDASTISAANMRSLEQQVLGAGEVVLGASDKIQDDVIRKRVRAIVCDRILQVYSQIHAMVHEPSSMFVDPQSICSYTPDQFKMMLSI